MIVTNLTKHPIFLGKRAILPVGKSELSRGVARDCASLIDRWVNRGFLRVEDTAEPKPAPQTAVPTEDEPTDNPPATVKVRQRRSTIKKRKSTKKSSTSSKG